MTLLHWILVACGGFIGAILRFQLTERLNRQSVDYPLGTWLVNMVGSFIIGLLVALPLSMEWRLLIIAGGLGAFTTYSTLQKELYTMWQQGKYKMFLKYVLGTYGVGLLLVAAGYLIGRL